MTKKYKILRIYTDGACRNNGTDDKGSCAYMILDESDSLIYRGGYYISKNATNNILEYKAILYSLKKLVTYDFERALLYSDSNLAIKQINKIWKVKNNNLKIIHEKILEIKSGIPKISFTHVRRENKYIMVVDRWCNEILDEK